jgi:hypothetical protein
MNGGAYNPWLRLYCAVSGSAPVDFLDVSTGTWLPPRLAVRAGVGTAAVAAVCEQPFQLFGQGCPGPNSVEPRLRWSGLPFWSGTAAITLKSWTANTAAMFMIGSSRANSPFGTLPLEGSTLGAPGCWLLSSSDVVILQSATGGLASQALALPGTPALSGMTAYAQWGVLAPVNPLGLVTTAAVEIRVR